MAGSTAYGYLSGAKWIMPVSDWLKIYQNEIEITLFPECKFLKGLAILEFSLPANRRFCFRSGRSLSTLSAVVMQALAWQQHASEHPIKPAVYGNKEQRKSCIHKKNVIIYKLCVISESRKETWRLVSAQPAPSRFESDSVVCSSTNRNNGRTAWDAKDEIIGWRNYQNIGIAA